MAGIERVPVTKSKGYVSIDTAKIPQDVWDAIVAEGLKVYVNGGMSKINTKGLEGEELSTAQAAAQAKAEENAQAILDGTIKLKGRKAKGKTSGAVMTEAKRLAKNWLKDQAKAAGAKVSIYSAKEWTEAATLFLSGDRGSEFMAQAEKNIAARQEAKSSASIDLASILPGFDKAVAAGRESKAKAVARGKQLSAKQAGLVAKRKPSAQPTAH